MSRNPIGEPVKKYIRIGTRRLRVTVYTTWTYDQEPIDVDFGDEENAKYEARFESGELVNICIQVQAIWQDAEGLDSLGACHVTSKAFESDVAEAIKEHAMIDAALDDLKDTIVSRSKTYAGFSI